MLAPQAPISFPPYISLPRAPPLTFERLLLISSRVQDPLQVSFTMGE